jgi:hypothetical protein
MVGGSPDGKRHRDDFYPTPPEATRALLSVETFKGLIWEPACGDGSMSRVLQERYPVVSTDLVDRGFGASGQDFLMQTRVVENIVTNPPFKLLLPFARKALELSTGKVAFLARITVLEGIDRSKFLQSSPLKSVYVFSRRLTFNRGGTNETHGGGMLAFCWLVWDHTHEGPATIGWLDAKEFMTSPAPLLDDYDAAKDSWNNYNTALGAMRCRRKGIEE